VDSVLDALNPLVDLLEHTADPQHTAGRLLEATEQDVRAVWAVLDDVVDEPAVVAPTLAHARILTRPARTAELHEHAARQAAAAQALLAQRHADSWQLVLTVPGFLRAALDDLAGAHPGQPRPRQTATVLTELAAGAATNLIIAAPYLDTGFVRYLIEPVTKLLRAGGHVLVLTRALSLRAPQTSSANVEAVEMLRRARGSAEAGPAGTPSGQLRVCSWEERGLGLHFKAVVADRRRAYLGSSNVTVGGALGHG
jgi:phosphatidylserine/phosphatidylglycerophosphate/cardiolipin synthase-like enzyme